MYLPGINTTCWEFEAQAIRCKKNQSLFQSSFYPSFCVLIDVDLGEKSKGDACAHVGKPRLDRQVPLRSLRAEPLGDLIPSLNRAQCVFLASTLQETCEQLPEVHNYALTHPTAYLPGTTQHT